MKTDPQTAGEFREGVNFQPPLTTWRIAACRDYWSKYELGWHISPTANQHDAIASIELAIVEAEGLLGCSILESMADPVTGELIRRPVTIVTDNGGPFRSDRFARFIDRPVLHHVRTRVRSPGQNGSRERGFGTLKYERLFLEEIRDGIELQSAAEAYRIEYNKISSTSLRLLGSTAKYLSYGNSVAVEVSIAATRWRSSSSTEVAAARVLLVERLPSQRCEPLAGSASTTAEAGPRPRPGAHLG